MDFGDLAIQMTGQIHENVKDKTLTPWVLPNFSTATASDTVICSVLLMSTLKRSILDRLPKLREFGDEPAQWANLLEALLKRLVRAFHVGGPQTDKAFWDRMVHQVPRASGPIPFISGWLGAFCAWDNKEWAVNLSFDMVWFPRVMEPPKAYAEVDVVVKDGLTGKSFDCSMIAGHISTSLDGKGRLLKTVRMAPHWFMYVKGDPAEPFPDY
ncbi:hypothetical protein DXG03_004223 [Asterophora parasitica]|uniref:Uncharacterized protein n=1 Tax=Asterophora parasitica TaxID=117018 RepID=A0A9P7KES1_9AGAR|nr:hypothetical protein DXG03_004223 [Asterophora parasitica]